MRWTRRVAPSSTPVRVDLDAFHAAAKELGFTLDDAQLRAAEALAAGDRNLYLSGPVGRGKSWLMSTYFAALRTDRKLRVHFHEFFRDLHLTVRKHHNDLEAALDDLLNGLDVVCFDEFHVHDPADGIFITRLLPALFERDIRVVLTSNYAPHSLLPNPLFHDDFIPTIELIDQSMTVLIVDGPVDYRTVSGHEAGFAAGAWVSPGSPDQIERLGLSSPAAGEQRILAPAGHAIDVRRATKACLWIEFRDLCEKATAPVDYLALAAEYRQWVIDGVPDLRSAGREPAQRFANVIDVLYDRDVITVFLATTSLDDLISGARLPIDIGRIESRLAQLTRIERNTPRVEMRF